MRPIHPRSLLLPRRTLRAGMPWLACLVSAGAFGQGATAAAVPEADLEEMVVTARKVPEDIARVPMSVQALSRDFLERRDLASLYDLQYAVPGLVLNNRGLYGAGISLRGVADEGGSSLSVAPHLDGVYLGRSTLALARPFDLERVEVVKGPQGTLYGRNATGGSINVITRTPEPELSAALEASRGTFDTSRLEGHVNVPGDSVALRVAFAGAEGDGFIRNSVDDRRFAEEDYWGVRTSVSARPTQALSIGATLQRVIDDGASGELWLPRRDRLPDPGDIHLTTVTLANPHHETTNDFASLDVAYEFSGLTARSITGYALDVTRDLDDCAGTAELPGCVRGASPLRYQQFSQEFRLESRRGETFDWLAGAYYFDGTESQDFRLDLTDPPRHVFDYHEVEGETAYAVFGDATLRIARRWRLNGGVRVAREDRSLSHAGTGLRDPPAPVSTRGSWDSTSWRAGIDYAPDDRWFLYANASTGFRSGGLTIERLLDGQFDDFDPEKIVAYEAGLNARWRGGRSTLRVSAFAYDFTDMQVTTTAVIAGFPETVVDNAASARIDGVDVSSSTRLGEHFTVTGGLVWLPRREFVEFIDERGNSLAGQTITRAPEWSGSLSLGFRRPVAGIGEFGADLDFNYRTAFYFTKENIASQYQGDFGLLDLHLRFDSANGRWYAFASARNLLDADYFTQVFLQSAPGYPTRYEAGVGWRM